MFVFEQMSPVTVVFAFVSGGLCSYSAWSLPTSDHVFHMGNDEIYVAVMENSTYAPISTIEGV